MLRLILVSLMFFILPAFDSQGSASKVVEVTIFKFKFTPEIIEINVGDTVRWVNKEKIQYHSVWFKEQGLKESDYIFPKENFEMKFETAGTFKYICGPHPRMIGLVMVK